MRSDNTALLSSSTTIDILFSFSWFIYLLKSALLQIRVVPYRIYSFFGINSNYPYIFTYYFLPNFHHTIPFSHTELNKLILSTKYSLAFFLIICIIKDLKSIIRYKLEEFRKLEKFLYYKWKYSLKPSVIEKLTKPEKLPISVDLNN